MERRKDELMKVRDRQIRELDRLQKKVSELEHVFVQTQNEWKEAVYRWNGANIELVLDKELLRELSMFADRYEEDHDFSSVYQAVMDVLMQNRAGIESALTAKETEAVILLSGKMAACRSQFQSTNLSKSVCGNGKAGCRKRGGE